MRLDSSWSEKREGQGTGGELSTAGQLQCFYVTDPRMEAHIIKMYLSTTSCGVITGRVAAH